MKSAWLRGGAGDFLLLDLEEIHSLSSRDTLKQRQHCAHDRLCFLSIMCSEKDLYPHFLPPQHMFARDPVMDVLLPSRNVSSFKIPPDGTNLPRPTWWGFFFIYITMGTHGERHSCLLPINMPTHSTTDKSPQHCVCVGKRARWGCAQLYLMLHKSEVKPLFIRNMGVFR